MIGSKLFYKKKNALQTYPKVIGHCKSEILSFNKNGVAWVRIDGSPRSLTLMKNIQTKYFTARIMNKRTREKNNRKDCKWISLEKRVESFNSTVASRNFHLIGSIQKQLLAYFISKCACISTYSTSLTVPTVFPCARS